MPRSTLYVVIAMLAAGVLIIGYLLFQERQQPTGVEIKIGEGGISIQEK